MTRDVERTLIVFAKVPRPGRVKTRLAAAIGDVEAASLYGIMGRRVLDGVRGGRYRLIVYIDPANELAAAREWLGAGDVGFRPQEGDDLGERLAEAFRREFQRARQVCAIGTDAPAVDRRVVERAFDELSANDLVLGPALDGGYYLIGATACWPELFRDVPWSTEGVMTATLARARALQLRTATLEPLPDIDTVEDLERADALPGPQPRTRAGNSYGCQRPGVTGT